ncbi:maleylpyruvate isomerase N-terminal domain-containing protein [Actinophytocola sediminis]
MADWGPRRWTEVFDEQSTDFRRALRAADLGARVPSCPGWTFTELTLHVGRFLDQVTRYLTSGSPLQLRARPPAPVADPVAYLDTALAAAAAALADTPANRPVWTFSPAAPDLAWVWHRRAAHELNLRRWDAQATLRTLEPTGHDQAVDAIDELLGTLLAARQLGDSPPQHRGTAIVSTTDGPRAWFVRLVPGQVPEVRPAAPGEQADALLEGRAENLLYQLRNRMRLTGTGDEQVLRGLRMS